MNENKKLFNLYVTYLRCKAIIRIVAGLALISCSIGYSLTLSNLYFKIATYTCLALTVYFTGSAIVHVVEYRKEVKKLIREAEELSKTYEWLRWMRDRNTEDAE